MQTTEMQTTSQDIAARRIELDWSVGHHAQANETPARFVPAQVPGAVHLDWARAENWPPHWQAENFRLYDWMEDCFWTYRATLPQVEVGPNERLFFVCGGVDYQWELWLDGERVHEQEGMFKPFELEISRENSGKELRIRVHPTPKTAAEPRNRAQASHSVKPAVPYGRDWHPRRIPLGIWDEAFLEIRSQAFLQRAEVFCTSNDDFSTANLRLQCHIDGVDAHMSTHAAARIR